MNVNLFRFSLFHTAIKDLKVSKAPTFFVTVNASSHLSFRLVRSKVRIFPIPLHHLGRIIIDCCDSSVCQYKSDSSVNDGTIKYQTVCHVTPHGAVFCAIEYVRIIVQWTSFVCIFANVLLVAHAGRSLTARLQISDTLAFSLLSVVICCMFLVTLRLILSIPLFANLITLYLLQIQFYRYSLCSVNYFSSFKLSHFHFLLYC